MKNFKTNFDIIDDANDTLEFSNQILNQYFECSRLNTFNNYSESVIDDESFHNYFNDNQILQTNEGTVSQIVRDISATTNDQQVQASETSNKRHVPRSESSTDMDTKKMKTTDKDANYDTKFIVETHTIPSCLLLANKHFIAMAKNIAKINKCINVLDIHDLAMLFYKKASLHIDRDITKAYFHSVQGTLKEPDIESCEVKRSVWPPQVQSFMSTKQQAMKETPMPISTETTMATTSTWDIDDPQQSFNCSDLLLEQIQKMKEQIDIYQEQIDDKKNSLLGFTTQIEDMIINYVQEHHLKPLELKRKLKMALLYYDFDTEILKRQYLQEKPNDYQIKMAQTLYDTKREAEKSKRHLLELKEQVFYDKCLLKLDSVETSIIPKADKDDEKTFPTSDKNPELKNIDLMMIKLLQAETKFYRDQKTFDDQLSTMWSNHRNAVPNQLMPTVLINIIEKSLEKIKDRWRAIYKYRSEFYLQNSYDDMETKSINDIDVDMQYFGRSLFVIMDTNYKFPDQHLQLISRGPTYVPPFQLSINSSIQTIEDRIKKQFAPLKHQLNSLFSNNHINLGLSMEINNKMMDAFRENFSLTIPEVYEQRAKYERKLIQTIRYLLMNNNLILRRTADNRNTFYVGNRSDFETKANDYLSQSDSIKFITDMDDNQEWKNENKEMIDSMNFLLEQLKNHKAITNDIYEQLLINIDKVQLQDLYFLPDISKENQILLVPYIVTHHSATTKLGKILHQVLQPFVNKVLKPTTFRDDMDFIKKFISYNEKEHLLQQHTIFCTIEITNFSTLDNHTNMIDTIGYFLKDNLVSNKLEDFTVQTIKNLLYIFLNSNAFVYNKRLYKITKGCPTTMPLSETLSNIYIFQWEKMIFEYLRKQNEFFGRHKNQVFFTWTNETVDELTIFLQDIKDKRPDVHFRQLTGYNVVFLNTFIENQEGQFYSRIYHHPVLPRFTLPYIVGHSKSGHSDWLRSALIRAVCCCSSIEDFHRERIYLEVSYLINGYSLLFIETHIQHFFEYFHTPHLRYTNNQTEYDQFRKQWLHYMDIRYVKTDQLQVLDNQARLIRLHYLYEWGPICEYNQKFLQLWSQYFRHHPILSNDNSKLLISTKHQYSLNALIGLEK
ncbi:unnamed protein product [Rotaria sp. Silwood2]|nr:unnamed protein product [Rotaria sp. Silwood2]